ncbi:hypothetical protein wcw_0018 [Waddlia chondrophila WSU 86-1044]|uniref:Uncharacterized protein n=1 Tax=Waddlia chondrophila (strain ATCC VR-1470 / WSU 86-1044) TaxID=716544 RepID=D6YTD4_WADCW|nr:hypothetical protein wcw_0018 [Waddlia chondrophila WSU 86-1044]
MWFDIREASGGHVFVGAHRSCEGMKINHKKVYRIGF